MQGFTWTRDRVKRVKNIIPLTVVSSTASIASSVNSTTYGANFNCTLQAITGPVYLNSLVTATTANGLLLNSGSVIDLEVQDILSLISDSTLATYQAVIWE